MATSTALGIRLITKKDHPMIIDYIIYHQKSNKSTSPKVFKWKNFTLAAGQSNTMRRKHAIKPITTRVYYPGLYGLEVLANGRSLAKVEFELVTP